MLKTTGKEFKKFYYDESYWPNEVWHDDETLLVDGAEWPWEQADVIEMPDTAEVQLDGGHVRELPDGQEMSFESYFMQWRKRQCTVRLLIEVPGEKQDAVLAAVTEAGGRLIG